MPFPLKVLLSYAHEDEDLKKRLDVHLSSLKRSGKIKTWSDREIIPGTGWDDSFKDELSKADIILLLVSADFLASDYIWRTELIKAMERHNSKESVVIPIFLRPCDWKEMPFASIQGLPKDAKPVSEHGDREFAFLEIAMGIRAVVENFGAGNRAHVHHRNVR
jgi:hypothetical protein